MSSTYEYVVSWLDSFLFTFTESSVKIARALAETMIDADIAAASSSYGSGDLNPKQNAPLIQAGSNMVERESRIGRMVLATFVAALGPLSFGYCLGYSSSALLDFEKESDNAVRFTDSQGSWFAVSVEKSLQNEGKMN